MRVAIIHYWFVGMRGGEKVIEALCKIYPQADIFTHVYQPEFTSAVINRHCITTSFISKFPKPARFYKSYLPLMPMALEQLDLRGYDLVISSESGPSKGIIPPPDSVHICYCHSPMRYVWNMFHDYRDRSNFLTKFLMPFISHYIRNWDVISATRVHNFIVNSANVGKRVSTYYRRDSEVIYPPVETSAFEIVQESEVSDYYLMVGELVAYKRPDLAIEAFNRTGKKLVIIGGGEMLKQLKAMAKSNITFLGSQPFDQLRHHYSRCKALIFPGEEDFGIVPVEAMASGRPVIAYGKGGALETVVDGVTGVFFKTQSVEAILDALDRLETIEFDPHAIAKHAFKFDETVFLSKMKKFIDKCLVEGGKLEQQVSESLKVSEKKTLSIVAAATG